MEGREPLPGGGQQGLHRDFSSQRPGDTVNALVYLDDYDAGNGATRVVPGSHRPAAGLPVDPADESRARFMEGRAGDALVFDADLLHAASRNADGRRRRTLLIGYRAAPLHALHLKTAALRNVRMDTGERFDP